MEKTSSIYGKHTKQQTNNNTSRGLKDLFGYYNYRTSSSTWGSGNKSDATNNNYAKGELTGSNAAAAAFSWPPRSYTCSFCKREFRSAQALGGHMNVHRRDRARLHQSPVRDISNIGQYPLLNLDPNPSSSSLTLLSPSQTNSAPHYPKYPHLAALTPNIKNVRPLAVDFMKVRSGNRLFGVENKGSFASEVVKKAEFVRLDLEIGLISHQSYKYDDHEELDLELRL